jgi:2-methylisocitrate lyase-like PEP mutase family enzyme
VLGASAVATSSAAMAWAHGLQDGEHLPFEQLLSALGAVLRAVRVPVTVDLERGYAASPESVASAVCRLAAAGVVGVNLEDGVEPPAGFASKLAACREALRARGMDVFLNARTDVLLRHLATGERALDEVLVRAERYAAAGCDGLFVPGLSCAEDLSRVARRVPVPLNVWASPALPAPEELRTLGVRRVSVGPGLALAALSAAKRSAELTLGGSWKRAFEDTTLTYKELNGWFRRTSSTAQDR